MLLEDVSEITIYEVEKLKTDFLDELSTSENISLDMKNIHKIDIVGLQLLISFIKTTHNLNKKIELINITASLKEQIESSYMSDSLGVKI